MLREDTPRQFLDEHYDIGSTDLKDPRLPIIGAFRAGWPLWGTLTPPFGRYKKIWYRTDFTPYKPLFQ